MDDYADIRQHSRYRLRVHRPMNETARAAQFAAFAALSGFDETIDETARLTELRENPAEDDLAALDAAFQQLLAADCPVVTVTYFQPDAHKDGGSFRTHTGQFRRYDAEENTLVFTDGTRIPAPDAVQIMLSG